MTRLTLSGAGLRPLPALRQRFAPDGCSHATRGVAYALTQPSVRRQSTCSTRSGQFTRFWLVRPLRQTGPTLSFDAFAPAAWLLLHLFVYPKLTHAPVRRLVWLVRHTETVHLPLRVTVNLTNVNFILEKEEPTQEGRVGCSREDYVPDYGLHLAVPRHQYQCSSAIIRRSGLCAHYHASLSNCQHRLPSRTPCRS